MNSRLLSVLLLATALHSASYAQTDIRVVNGAQVDLSRLHQWLAGKQKGDRPLKHWHRAWVVDYRRTYGSWDLCVLRLESGTEVEALVDHLPRDIRNAYYKYNQAKAELESLRAQVQAAESRLALVRSDNFRRQSQEEHQLRRNIDSAKHRLSLLVEQVGTRDSFSFRGSGGEISTHRSSNGSLASECARLSAVPLFVMFTGRTYASHPVWDTGKIATQ